MKYRFFAPLIALVCIVFANTGPAFAGYTVNGRFQYEDRTFDLSGFTGTTLRPIRFADVRILAGTIELGRGATLEDGSYSISIADSSAQNITALCVTSSNQSSPLLLSVRSANNDYSFGDYYSVSSDPQAASGSSSVSMGTTIAQSKLDIGKAFNLWDVAVDALQFAASPSAAGSYPPVRLTVTWRLDHPRTGAFFSTGSGERYVFISGYSAYDDTILAHEIGHFIDNVYSKSDNPGYSHFIGDNNQDMRLSWGEGLATFLGSSSRLFKGYARPEIYVNTDGTNLNWAYEVERLTGSFTLSSKTGSTNEAAVTAALWDIIDGGDTPDADPGSDDDPLQAPFSDVWKVLTRCLTASKSAGITVETFWDGWFSALGPNNSLASMQTMFSSVNGIEFQADAFEPDDAAASARVMQVPLKPPPVAGPKVILSEIDMGNTDAAELYNGGDREADISGWVLEAGAGAGSGASRAINTIPPFKLAPGAFVILSEANGKSTNSIIYFNKDSYPDRNISWANGTSGYCALKDSKGSAVDFVRWGDSAEPPPNGTGFIPPNPDSPPADRNLARAFSEADTDSGADWSVQAPSLGTFNSSGQESHRTYYPAGDVDYTAFDAKAGFHYLVETANLQNGADTTLEILDTNGTTLLASNDDFGNSKASRLSWLAPSSAKYYVRSRRFDADSNFAQYGSYDLRIVESASPFTVPLPDTITVSEAGQGGRYQSLSDAIYAAANGDTVQIIDNGTYRESPVISGKSITLKAAAGKSPVIDGRGPGFQRATLSVSNGKTLRIEGLSILGGARGIQINGGSVTIVNSIIAGATDPSGFADGIQVTGSGSSLTLVNSTVVHNGRLGVGVFNKGSASVVNSIVYGNCPGCAANQPADVDDDRTSTALILRNSLLGTRVYSGSAGYTVANPQFVDLSAGDYHLKSGSPAIDAGDPIDPNLPATDADGLPRSIDGKRSGKALPDIGAYEYLPPGLLTSTAIFPQIAAGGAGPAYQTSIVAMNIGSQIALANLSLTGSDAKPLPVTVLTREGVPQGASAAPSGNTEVSLSSSGPLNMAIAPQGTIRLDVAGSAGTVSGYAQFLSSVPISGTALFKTVSGDAISSEAGVGMAKPARNFTVYIDNTGSANSGYAVANFGAAPADVVMTLRDKSGTSLESQTFTLAPGAHLAKFAAQEGQFPAKAAAGFEGSIEFSGSQPVAAVALRYDNPAQDVFSTIPVLADEAATTLYFPQVADGNGYRTNFILVNPSGTAATARLEFFGSNGSPMELPISGVGRKLIDLPLSPKGVARLITDGTSAGGKVGWVKVTSLAGQVAIGGSAVFQRVNGATIISEAGVASSPAANHFSTYVESLGSTSSGIALCNPNAGKAGVTLKLRNSSGLEVANTSFELAPSEHTAKFFTQWFPNGFTGFQGTLEVIATLPVSAVALRYDNPGQNVFATLPVIVIP